MLHSRSQTKRKGCMKLAVGESARHTRTPCVRECCGGHRKSDLIQHRSAHSLAAPAQRSRVCTCVLYKTQAAWSAMHICFPSLYHANSAQARPTCMKILCQATLASQPQVSDVVGSSCLTQSVAHLAACMDGRVHPKACEGRTTVHPGSKLRASWNNDVETSR